MIDHAGAPRGVELGHPGASAHAEFERRRRGDAAVRRHRLGPVLAPVVALVTGTRPSTARWRVGGDAEEQVGQLLSAAVGEAGVVLHDRAVPRGRANIDHIAVVPSGVWVIDTKCYRGQVRRARRPGRIAGRNTLAVNGHDRSHLLDAVLRQRALVESAAGQEVAVRAVLCFAGAEWGLWARPFVLRGVAVTWPGALAARWGPAGPSASTNGRLSPPGSPGPSHPTPASGAPGCRRRQRDAGSDQPEVRRSRSASVGSRRKGREAVVARDASRAAAIRQW